MDIRNNGVSYRVACTRLKIVSRFLFLCPLGTVWSGSLTVVVEAYWTYLTSLYIKDDNSITVHPADKGRATVIMDRDGYYAKMETLVGDNNTYEKLSVDPTQHHMASIITTLLAMKNYLPATTYYRLTPSMTANPPLLFSQPKVHKVNMLLRPIVLCRNTIFSGLTKECGLIIAPIVGKYEHHIKDSVDMVDKLR